MATWLDTPKQCSYTLPDGSRCQRHVIAVRAGNDTVYGTRCALPKHGGARQREKLVKELQGIKLQRALRQIARPIEGDPADIMLQLVWESNGLVAYYRDRVRMLQTPVNLDPAEEFPELFDPAAGEVTDESIDEVEFPMREIRDAPDPNLQSPTPAPSRSDPYPVAPSDPPPVPLSYRALIHPDHLGNLAPNILLKLYNEERDRLAGYVKKSIELGIQERQQRIAEGQQRAIAQVLIHVLDHPLLELTAEQKMSGRRIAAESMRELDANLRARVQSLNPPPSQSPAGSE